jgi:hypothetical protein
MSPTPYELLKLAHETSKNANVVVAQVAEMQSATGRVDSERLTTISHAAAQIIGAMAKLLPKPGRFVVREHFNGFSVVDTKTGKDHWLCDGVDCVADPDRDDDWLPPGGELFCLLWAEHFNTNEAEMMEAYFPDDMDS